jgi:hypothetical protein
MLALLGSVLVLPVVDCASVRDLIGHGGPIDVKTDEGWVDLDAVAAQAQDDA